MKNTFKRALPYILMLCMSVAFIPTNALAIPGFPDMPAEDNWAYAALQSAAEHGILAGDEKGRLKPSANTTRAQAATVINRVFGAVEEADLSAYNDVSPESWYYSELAKASQMRTFLGYGTKLYPNRNITREQLFVALARAISLDTSDYRVLDSFSDGNAVSDWAKGSVAALVSAGYVNGDDGKLKPQANIRREELAQVLYNIFQQYIDQPGTYTKAADGNLVVSASDVTLKDLKVSGDLILGDGVGNGDFTLDNVAVSGRIIVRGGGEHSVKITNRSNVGEVIVAKAASGGVRVLSSGGASVGVVRVGDGTDAVKLEGAFQEVRVVADTPLVLTEATVSQLTVASEKADVSIQSGSVVSLNVAEAASAATITTGKDSSVGTLTVASSATLDISGAVTQVTVSESAAAAPTLALSDTAKVSTLTVAKGADVTVQTDNAKAIGTIKSDDAKSVTVVSDNSGVKSQIESKSESGSSSSAGSSSGRSSHTTPPSGTVTTAAQFLSALSNSRIKTIAVASDMTVSAYLTISKPVTVNAGVTLTFSNQISLGSTLTNNGTVCIRDTYLEIADTGRFINNGSLTCSTGVNVLRVFGTLDGSGTVSSALDVYASRNATVMGFTGKVFVVGEPDVYDSEGNYIPNDTINTITKSDGITLVTSRTQADAYGEKGLMAALAADVSYITLKAQNSPETVTLSETVTKPSTALHVTDDVTLDIASPADITFQHVVATGKLHIESGAKLTAATVSISGGEIDNDGSLDVEDYLYMMQGAKGSGLSGQKIYLGDLEDSFYEDGTSEISGDYVIKGEYTQINDSYSRIAFVHGSAGMDALARLLQAPGNEISYDEVVFSEAETGKGITLPDGFPSVRELRLFAKEITVTIPAGKSLTAEYVAISEGRMIVSPGAAISADSISISDTLINNGILSVRDSIETGSFHYAQQSMFDNRKGTLDADEALRLSAHGQSTMLGIPGKYTVDVSHAVDFFYSDGTMETDDFEPVVTGGAAVNNSRYAVAYEQAGLNNLVKRGVIYSDIDVQGDDGAPIASLTLPKSLTIRGRINIPEGTSFIIPSGVSLSVESFSHVGDLTVERGGQLTAEYSLDFARGTVTNSGTVTCSSLYISDGSSIDDLNSAVATAFTNNGSLTITAKEDTSYISGHQTRAVQGSNAYWGIYGELVLSGGATLQIDSDILEASAAKSGFYCANGIHLIDCYSGTEKYTSELVGDHVADIIRWRSTAEAYDYTGWKTAVDEDVPVTVYFPITLTEDIVLTQAVFADTVTIPTGKTLTVKNYLECYDLIIEDGGKLVVEQDDETTYGSLLIHGLTNDGAIVNGGTITLMLSEEDGELPSYKTGDVSGNAIQVSTDAYQSVESPADFWEAQDSEDLATIFYRGNAPLSVDGEKTIKKPSVISTGVIVPDGATLNVSNLTACNNGITVQEGGTLSLDLGTVINLNGKSAIAGTLSIKSGTVQVMGELQLTGQVEWEDNAIAQSKLIVNSNTSLYQNCGITVPQSGRIRIYNGTYYIGGTLTNSGKIFNEYGKLVIQPTGSLTNNGTIAETDDDHLEIIGGGTFTNNNPAISEPLDGE